LYNFVFLVIAGIAQRARIFLVAMKKLAEAHRG